MIKRMKEIKALPEDFGTLAVCALRYCMGRETYMPGLVRDIIRPHLPELDNKTITVMLMDCEGQAKDNCYGHERIDKPGWIKWKGELEAEKSIRGME